MRCQKLLRESSPKYSKSTDCEYDPMAYSSDNIANMPSFDYGNKMLTPLLRYTKYTSSVCLMIP